MNQAQTPLVPADSVIAIDGPAGSGKSTTARALAHRLGLLYVDTGAMYRALTWAGHAGGVSSNDETSLADLLRNSELELDSDRNETRVLWNGRDISESIRAPEIESLVSTVAAHGAVRELMVERQRAYARRRGVVMEGRDIGSVVFPLASAKIYLDASLEARADRRMRQHQRRGIEIGFEEVLSEVADRDRLDSEREISPLTIAPDAVVIDNSHLSLDEQLERSVSVVEAVLEEQRPRGVSLASPSARPTIRYRIAYAVFSSLGRLFGLQVYGREHAFFDEGKIIAANHVSSWDPPFLAAALAEQGSMRSVAKEELFRTWGGRLVFSFLNSIPIKRSCYDVGAFEQARHYLSIGENIVFFPEGIRRVVGEPGPVRNGLGSLMQATGAPAVPAFFRGTVAPRPGGGGTPPLECWFAPPVRLRALPTLRERHTEREIDQLVARLFDEIYRELQARSCAKTPFSDLERGQARRSRDKVRRKEERTFRKTKTS